MSEQKVRTASELNRARRALGLSAQGMSELLRLPENGGRTVRRWESGERAEVPGPVQVILEALLVSPELRVLLKVDEIAARHPAYQAGNPQFRASREARG